MPTTPSEDAYYTVYKSGSIESLIQKALGWYKFINIRNSPSAIGTLHTGKIKTVGQNDQ